MKIATFIGITFLVMIFTACSSAEQKSSSADININFEGLKTDLKIKDAVCYKFGYVPENKSTTYAVEFANFDADLENKKFDSIKLGEGQTKLRILLSVRDDGSGSDLKTGQFSNEIKLPKHVVRTLAYTFQDGKEKMSDMDITRSKGIFELSAVTETEIKGKLDLNNDSYSIKGSFSAKRIEKAE